MKHGSDIVSTIHSLKIAQEHMQSFIRAMPRAVISSYFKRFHKQIDQMYVHLKSEPALPDIVRQGINQELNSDVFAVPALMEKIPLLPPNHREVVEILIDKILEGEPFEFEMK